MWTCAPPPPHCMPVTLLGLEMAPRVVGKQTHSGERVLRTQISSTTNCWGLEVGIVP